MTTSFDSRPFKRGIRAMRRDIRKGGEMFRRWVVGLLREIVVEEIRRLVEDELRSVRLDVDQTIHDEIARTREALRKLCEDISGGKLVRDILSKITS